MSCLEDSEIKGKVFKEKIYNTKMEDKNYTNQELARDYFSVVAQYAWDIDRYREQRRLISESGIDLISFYQEHGGFKELKVKGIGPKTKLILELLLEKGVEEARRLFREERIDKIQSNQWSGRSRKVSKAVDDVPPSWDGAVRRYEGD